MSFEMRTMSLGVRLFTLVVCSGVALPLLAQRSLNPKPPKSRAPSTLTTADSMALATAAARWIVAHYDTIAAPCVTEFDQTIKGKVGVAFAREARTLASALPPVATGSNESWTSNTLTGFVDGDTAGVMVSRFNGDAKSFSERPGVYYFARTPTPGEWRFVFRIDGGFGDYIVDPDQPAPPRPRCMNGRKR